MSHPAKPAHKIGPWTFTPSRNELEDKGVRVHLEDRAARVLDLLCGHRGEVVSREMLLKAVWQGRALSENSVAVVISDLRRALGDDARTPLFIETVAKRGYRLLPAGPAVTPAEEAGAQDGPSPSDRDAPGRPARRLSLSVMSLAAAVAAGLAALAGFYMLPAAPVAPHGAPAVVVTVNNMKNATGDPRYDPLVAAINELSAAYLTNAGNHILIRDRWAYDAKDPSKGLYKEFGADAQVYHLSGKVVLEAGRPVAALFVDNPRNEAMTWAKTVAIESDEVAGPVQAALDDFLARIKRD